MCLEKAVLQMAARKALRMMKDAGFEISGKPEVVFDRKLRHRTLLTVLVVIEVLFLALFVFAFRAALRP